MANKRLLKGYWSHIFQARIDQVLDKSKCASSMLSFYHVAFNSYWYLIQYDNVRRNGFILNRFLKRRFFGHLYITGKYVEMPAKITNDLLFPFSRVSIQTLPCFCLINIALAFVLADFIQLSSHKRTACIYAHSGSRSCF